MTCKLKIIKKMILIVFIIVLNIKISPVSAAEIPKEGLDIANGSLWIINDTRLKQNDIEYTFDNNVGIVVKGTSDQNNISVIRDAGTDKKPIKIIFENVTIDLSQSGCAFNIYEKAAVNLVLAENSSNRLESAENSAGIQVQELGGRFGILTIDGSGALTAVGGSLAAGIGGGNHGHWYSNGGKITINSGMIKAIGGVSAAGIGGGLGGSGGNIVINGGTIEAFGGENGAGIGGGHYGLKGKITQRGKEVYAVAGLGAEDIGSGGEAPEETGVESEPVEEESNAIENKNVEQAEDSNEDILIKKQAEIMKKSIWEYVAVSFAFILIICVILYLTKNRKHY